MPRAYDARDAYGRLRPAASTSGRPARGLVHDTTCCAISAARLAITRSVLQKVETCHRRSRRVADSSSANGPLIFWLYSLFGIRGATWFLGGVGMVVLRLLFLGFWNTELGIPGTTRPTGKPSSAAARTRCTWWASPCATRRSSSTAFPRAPSCIRSRPRRLSSANRAGPRVEPLRQLCPPPAPPPPSRSSQGQKREGGRR